MCNIGKDGRRHHTWPYSENKIEFDDKIIVSDEVPPSPQLDGKSYTLWTEAHENNVLQHDGRKSEPFCFIQHCMRKSNRVQYKFSS